MTEPAAPAAARRRRPVLRWALLALAAVGVVALVLVAIVVVPILAHRDQGESTQEDTGEAWPREVTAIGDDGRERTLSVATGDGGEVDTAAIATGDRIVVTGSGYDGRQGVYVAICVIDPSPSVKPGPCIGGVPRGEEGGAVEAGAVQWTPSTWINDDWAWKLFGARPYDDPATGAFTAYLEVGDPAADGIDCAVSTCAIVTRNDHTAAGDRVQDVRIPVGFVG